MRDLSSASGKIKKAEKAGIKVMELSAFLASLENSSGESGQKDEREAPPADGSDELPLFRETLS